MENHNDSINASEGSLNVAYQLLLLYLTSHWQCLCTSKSCELPGTGNLVSFLQSTKYLSIFVHCSFLPSGHASVKVIHEAHLFILLSIVDDGGRYVILNLTATCHIYTWHCKLDQLQKQDYCLVQKMAKTPLFFALLLNLYCLQTISAQSLPTSKFECYQFPESKPSSKISFDSDVFNTKTTYLKAWQFIRERNPNSTYYIDSNSCTAIYVFFIGRHSIRFPMKKEIVKFNEALPRLREELLRGGRLDRLVEADLLSWKLFINLAESARVTLSG